MGGAPVDCQTEMTRWRNFPSRDLFKTFTNLEFLTRKDAPAMIIWLQWMPRQTWQTHLQLLPEVPPWQFKRPITQVSSLLTCSPKKRRELRSKGTLSDRLGQLRERWVWGISLLGPPESLPFHPDRYTFCPGWVSFQATKWSERSFQTWKRPMP